MRRSRYYAGVVCVALAWGWVSIAAQTPELPEDLAGDPEARGFADLLYAQGMVAFARGDCAAALPLFEKASEAWSEEATYRYFAGLCKLRLGRETEAIAELRATLPPASNRVAEARVRYDLADAHYRLGDLAAARQELKRSIALDDSDAWSHFYLGLVLVALGETSAGFREVERAASMNASLEGDGAYYLGVAAHQRGDEAGARRYFEQALQSSIGDAGSTSARQWLSRLDEPEAVATPPRYDLKVTMSVEHDDNPGQINEDIVVPDVGADERLAVRLRASYQPLMAEEGWNVGLVLNGYASAHRDFDVADVNGVQGVVQAAWGADPLGYWTGPLGYVRVPPAEHRVGVMLQAGTSYFTLDDESFRRDHEVAASVLFQQAGFGKTQIELSYDDVTFLDPSNSPYSGHATMLRVGQLFAFGGRRARYVRLALARTEHSTELKALEHDTNQVLAELAFPFARRWIFFLY